MSRITFEIIDHLVEESRHEKMGFTTEPILEVLQEFYMKWGRIPNSRKEHYYRFFYQLVALMKPKFCLELGLYQGLGSAYMAAASQRYGGHVIGIDRLDRSEEAGRVMAHYDNLTYLQADSLQAEAHFSGLVNIGELGIVFQDSSHHYSESKQEWAIYSKYLQAGGIWICDDIAPAFHDPLVDPPGKGMVEYFSELPGEKKLYESVLHFGTTVGIILL